MTGLSPDLIQLALRDGWIDPVFLAARLGVAPEQLVLARLITNPSQRDLSLSARFDGGAYLERYPDVAAAKMPPLVHFLRHGLAEGRSAFADYTAVLQDVPPCAHGLWVESHDLGLTGAPMALAHVLAGLGRDGLGPVQMAAPCDGPMADIFARDVGAVLQHGQAAQRVQDMAQCVAMVARCAALLQRSGVARVLANSILSWPMVLAAQHLGLPVIWIIHEPDDSDLRAMFSGAICAKVRLAMQGAQSLIFVSDNSRMAWGAGGGANATVIAKSLPPATQAGSQRASGRSLARCGADDVLVLNVGTISPRKGQMDLIHALQALADHPHAAGLVVVMVGFVPSPYAQDLRAEVQQLRQRGLRVQLWPQTQTLVARQQVEQLFAAADIFVMTSRAESLPLTTSEALAAHCPVISTNAPGMGEMLVHGVTGLLYTAGQGGDLAGHIATLAAQPDLRAQMRAQIAARADASAYDHMIDAYSQILASLNRPDPKIQ